MPRPAPRGGAAGIAVLSVGLRPFFLGAAAWAALAMALWLAVLAGAPVRFALDPLAWHVHALLFGFAPGVVAGFLLTAAAAWTGRRPLTGPALLAMFVLWSVGRAISLVPGLGPTWLALVDGAFLVALGAWVTHAVVAARNWRNLGVAALVWSLLAADLVFLLGASLGVDRSSAARAGIAVLVALVLVIGGRVVPAFTRNWLASRGPGRMPAPAGGVDRLAAGAAALALPAWVVAPQSAPSAALALAAAVIHGLRLARWAGERTVANPLVLVLHVAYGLAVVGFLLVAVPVIAPGALGVTGAAHGWTVGAIGTMTLAMMTRASLGHTGRALAAGAATRLVYLAILVAVSARLAADLGLGQTALVAAGSAWIAAYGGFAAAYAGPLVRPRADARGGAPAA